MFIAALLSLACRQTIHLDHPAGAGGNGGSNDAATGEVVDAADDVDNNGDGGSGDAGDGPNDRVPRCPGGGVLSPISAERELPWITILFDRSSSMKSPFGNNSSRFSVTRDAIEGALNFYSDIVGFGYVEFPGLPSSGSCDNNCCVSQAIPIVKAGGNLMGIRDKLRQCTNQQSGQVGCPSTDSHPVAQAISRIDNSLPSTIGPHVALYAVLIAGGEPTCSFGMPPMNDLCTQAASQLSNLSLGTLSLSTFVMGVGDITGALNTPMTGNACLDQLALYGGAPRVGVSPYYYPAKTDALVSTHLNNIINSVVCRIDITEQNFDPDTVQLDLGDIPRDTTNTNGWNYLDPATRRKIAIYGATACEQRFVNLAKNGHQLAVKACQGAR